MKILLLLFTVFLLSATISRVATGSWNVVLAGNIGMCAMLFLTAFGHFYYPKGMEMMMPGYIPFKKELVFITGIIELLAGIGLLFPQYRYLTGVLLIVFFIMILPANIHAAVNHIDFQKATTDGSGVSYLWFRLPMQVLLIAWVWFFSIRRW